MGLTNEKMDGDSYYIACSPIDSPETAVPIAIRHMNIYINMTSVISWFPMSQVAQRLAEHIRTTHHIDVILPTRV